MRDVRRFLNLNHGAPSGAGVTVALIDGMVEPEHPALDRSKIQICEFLSFKGDPSAHHATHLAGIIVGRAQDPAFDGIAPDACLRVYPASRKPIDQDALAVAIYRAAKDGADIICLATTGAPQHLPQSGARRIDPPWVWSGRSYLENAIEETSSNILCVVAAGNSGPDLGTINCPAALPSVLCVAATDTQRGSASSFSSRGPGYLDQFHGSSPRTLMESNKTTIKLIPKPDICAPGEKIWGPHPRTCTTCPPSQVSVITQPPPPHYIPASGTSQAAAVVTGLAACALERLRLLDAAPSIGTGRLLHRLFLCAAADRKNLPSEAYGNGSPSWPRLAAAIDQFSRDESFRQTILGEEQALL
jgi:subtilisin family serine protease